MRPRRAPHPASLAVTLAAALALAACRAEVPEAPGSSTATTSGAAVADTPGTSAAPAASKAPAAPPVPAAPPPREWRRVPPAEPHPEARARYRRALDHVSDGHRVSARPLWAALRAEHAETRFGRRLTAEDSNTAGAAGLIGLAAAVLVPLYFAAPDSVVAEPPAPAPAPPPRK